MLAVLRPTSTVRPISSACLRAPILREYHGDPGPSSSNHRQSRRTVLRHAATTGSKRSSIAVNANKNLLDAILDAPTPTRAAAKASSPASASMSNIGRRPSSTSSPLVKSLRLPTPQTRPGSVASNSRRGTLKAQTKAAGNPHQLIENREETPYDTSMKLRRWIAKHPKNLTQTQTEEVIAIVTEARSNLVNAPVWNVLLGYMGRMQKFDRMWKLYNDMKKRGIQPTSRTYSTMLNAYAGASHSLEAMDRSSTPRAVEERTISRVTILFEQFQKYLKAKLASHQPSSASEPDLDDDLGLTSTKEGEVLREAEEEKAIATPQNEQIAKDDEIDVAPINAYLKFLGRHGMFSEMQKIYISMDTDGPLSPDNVTYTTMFATLHHSLLDHPRPATQPGNSNATNRKPQPELSIGPTARGIWDRCVRQFGKVHDKNRRIDNELLIHALTCFLRGRHEDQGFALKLIHQIWSLPPPGQSSFGVSSPAASSASTEPIPFLGSAVSSASTQSQLSGLPHLEPNLEAATALIQVLHSISRPHLGTHYTTLLLSNPKISFAADVRFLQSSMNVYASTGDVAGVMNLLDSFQISSGRQGWDMRAWRAAMTGARWAGDFDAALTIFRRAVHLPLGVENDDPQTKADNLKPYKWSPPNNQSEDVRGIKWVRPQPIPVDAGMLSNLLKTAMQKSNKDVKMALNIFAYLGGEKKIVVFPPTGQPLSELDPERVMRDHNHMTDSMKSELGRVFDLVKTLERATERLGSTGGAGAYARLKENFNDILRVWGEYDTVNSVRPVRSKGEIDLSQDLSVGKTVGPRRNEQRSPRTPDQSEPGSSDRHFSKNWTTADTGSSGRNDGASAYDTYAELYPGRHRAARRSDVDRDDGIRNTEHGRQPVRDPEGRSGRTERSAFKSRNERDTSANMEEYVPRKPFGGESRERGWSNIRGERTSRSRFGSERELRAPSSFGFGGKGNQESGRASGFGSTKKTFGLRRD
ncbi:hypothetical protein I317_04412 [Kwoniella heveanensis CBS 569]|nr:hypothetical protein I317_04412 [Kwoniella heveanensis CBS 569]